MDSIILLLLRQMRAPLLLLSTVYAVATIGLTLIPGMDDQGNVWHMDFFHAFYFVSFMGTTIGFGEIPYPFTDAQRMWALIFIYITVATWIYAIGALISLLKQESLKRAITEYQFTRQVQNLSERFFLVCGYGDTGSQLLRSLRSSRMAATVIEIDQDRIDALTLTDSPLFTPAICANAGEPHNLIIGGITHPLCDAVVALTNDNAVNLHIAIAARVLNPSLRVICRADSHEIEANLASFGTDHIVDPYDSFATLLGLAIHSPHQYMLSSWFHSESGAPLSKLLVLPRGRWILCGFGRFGRAVFSEMVRHGLEVTVIEPDTGIQDLPEGSIIGLGTEAVTLQQARAESAVGIIAGANDDSNNLSIMVTARELNPDLFVVLRQTENFNRDIFAASSADLLMASSQVLVNKVRTLLTNPLVDDFLSLARSHDDDWAMELTQRLKTISPDRLPHLWAIRINSDEAHAVSERLRADQKVLLYHLLKDHRDRQHTLPIIPLLHSNSRGAFSMPDLDTPLSTGDQLLFAGNRTSESSMRWILQNTMVLDYVVTGRVEPQTTIGRWFARRFGDSGRHHRDGKPA